MVNATSEMNGTAELAAQEREFLWQAGEDRILRRADEQMLKANREFEDAFSANLIPVLVSVVTTTALAVFGGWFLAGLVAGFGLVRVSVVTSKAVQMTVMALVASEVEKLAQAKE